MALNKIELSLSHTSGITGLPLFFFFSDFQYLRLGSPSVIQVYLLHSAWMFYSQSKKGRHISEGDYRLMAKAGTESVYFHPSPSLLPRYWV